MSQQEKCSQCLEQFTFINPPRIMTSCQHNICTKCLKEAIQHRQQFIECGYCTKKIKRKDIKLFPKNSKLIQKLKAMSLVNINSKDQKSNNNQNSANKNHSPVKQDEELLITSDTPQYQQSEFETICEIHKKPLDIICATDRKRICPHCAIFGNHKDHKFKTMIQFEDELRQKTCSFQQIMKKKQERQVENNLVNIKQGMNIKIQLRKSLIQNEISRYVQQLISMIRKLQKQICQQLQQKFRQVKMRINDNLSNEMRLKKNYISWQSSCQQVINKLKMTSNPKNKIQIYYNSPLQICQQGILYVDQMIQNITNLYHQNQQHINSISLKTQLKSFDNYITIVCPILQESILSKQLAKMQQSFEKDFPLKNQLATRQDLEQNSFIFDSQVSSIQLRQSIGGQNKQFIGLNKQFINPNKQFTGINKQFTGVKKQSIQQRNQYIKQKIQSIQQSRKSIGDKKQFMVQKKLSLKDKSQLITQNKQCKNKLNKSYTSINSINSLSAFMTMSPKNRSSKVSQDKNKFKQTLNKSRSSAQKRFGSPDFSKPIKTRQYKTPQQILISLSTNDFINEIDLSEMNLRDEDINEFLYKANKIRQIKAIKLQKNNLTDEGFELICKYLQHVSNLNISYNELSDRCLQILLRNKQYFYKMRIINLSNNRLTSDKTDIKIKGKLDQIKKLGIVVSL